MNKMRLLLHLRWLALYLFLLGLLLTPHSLQAQGALDDQAPDDTEAIHNLYLPMITHHFVQAPTLETNTEKDQSNLLADIPIERQARVDAQATGATAASNEIYLPIIGNLFGQSPESVFTWAIATVIGPALCLCQSIKVAMAKFQPLLLSGVTNSSRLPVSTPTMGGIVPSMGYPRSRSNRQQSMLT